VISCYKAHNLSDAQSSTAVSGHGRTSPKLYSGIAKYCEESWRRSQWFCCRYVEPCTSVQYS